jgi:transposase
MRLLQISDKGAVREPDYPHWNGYVQACFQLHGVDTAEQPVLRQKLRRKEMAGFFAKLPPTEIGMEACGAAHYWGRVLRELGHTVKLIAPQHVKPYIKRNKNDGRDAEGLCEAMSRPTMQFVPVKTEEQQAALMLVTRHLHPFLASASTRN